MILRRRGGLTIVVLVGLIVLVSFGFRRPAPAGVPTVPKPASGPEPPPNSLGLTYTTIGAAFRHQQPATVQGWIDTNDTKAMIEHAWEAWAGLSTETTQKVGGKDVTYPIFETWIDEPTVFTPPPAGRERLLALERPPGRLLAPAKQLFRRSRREPTNALEAVAPPVSPTNSRFVTVKYTKEIYQGVQDPQHKYYSGAELQALNDSWDKNSPPTPLALRNIAPFDDASIMLKPTYQVVSGTEATVLPYWSGPANSTSPSVPAAQTWTTTAMLFPPGVPKVPVSGKPSIDVSDFYNFKLNAAEVAAVNQQLHPTVGDKAAKVGDYAILVGMHVSTREIDNWTWQTFWWSFEKPKIPESVRSKIKPPFDHYTTAVGYSYTTGPDDPAGLNVLCFNPYLEAGFGNKVFDKPGQLGIESSCISCHRAAAWPNANTKYIANGVIDPGDPFFFANTTKTDFIWGIPGNVNPPSPPSPPAAPGGQN
jgi:hypothetical protein